jgi:gas vesicle protein
MAIKKNNSSAGKILGIGAVIAAAAGAYFLYGKGGTQRRKKVKGWALKAQGEVLEQMEKVKDFTEDKYDEIVDKVASKYSALKDIDRDEVDALITDLKKHWKSIKKDFDEKSKKAERK